MSHLQDPANLSKPTHHGVVSIQQGLKEIEKHVQNLVNTSQKSPEETEQVLRRLGTLGIIPMQMTDDGDVILGTQCRTRFSYGDFSDSKVCNVMLNTLTSGEVFWCATLNNSLFARRTVKSLDASDSAMADWEIHSHVLKNSSTSAGQKFLESLVDQVHQLKNQHEKAVLYCDKIKTAKRAQEALEVIGAGCEEANGFLKKYRL
jgi:hypothetical protein